MELASGCVETVGKSTFVEVVTVSSEVTFDHVSFWNVTVVVAYVGNQDGSEFTLSKERSFRGSGFGLRTVESSHEESKSLGFSTCLCHRAATHAGSLTGVRYPHDGTSPKFVRGHNKGADGLRNFG